MSDDPFTTGLKTCILQDLHDDNLNSNPRPWVPLPPTLQHNPSLQRNYSDEMNNSNTPTSTPLVNHTIGESKDNDNDDNDETLPNDSSEIAEVAWLFDLLRDLVNRYENIINCL